MENKLIITNLYNNLSIYKIDSKTRINIISNTYDIDRSTIFRWINDSKELIDKNNNNIVMLNNYKNKNITFTIETLIINNVSKYNSINKLKNFINTTLNTYISNNMIKCVLASNNIKFKNFSNININTFVKNNCIDNNIIIITNEIESYIINNKENSIKLIMNNVNLNFNIKCTKKDIIGILQKNKIHKKSFYKITPFVDNYVYNKIKNNNILTAKNIIDDLYKEYDILISTTSVYNIYKKHNLTFKKIKFNNNPKSLEDQKERVINVKTALESVNLNNVVSYDEMSIVLNSKPTDGWSEKGKECIVNINNSKIYSDRFTLGVATSNNKIINYCVVKKGLKTDNYITFMDKIYNDLENKENKTIFIDNASIHTSKKAKELYKKNKMHIIFNAPYHSEFNPIEYVFSILRNEINRNPNDTIEKIKLTIDNFINNIKGETLSNIFNNCIKKINNFIKD